MRRSARCRRSRRKKRHESSLRHRRHPRKGASISARSPDHVRPGRSARASPEPEARADGHGHARIRTGHRAHSLCRNCCRRRPGCLHWSHSDSRCGVSLPHIRCRSGNLHLSFAQSIRRQRREDLGHDGMKIPDAYEEQIEDEMRIIRRDDVSIPSLELREDQKLIEKYQQFLVSGVAPNALRGMKVVLDAGNGAAYRIAPEIFRRVGADVRVIHDQPNGRNINENAGALHPERLANVVLDAKANFGVAFDGDADRAIFVDDAGRVRDGDEIIYLWAHHLKAKRIVTTVMSNFGFERQLERDGIELLRAQVGDKYVLELMLERGAVIGGEQSGHIIDLTVHTTGDGIHTALVFGELLQQARKPFSKLRTFDPMPQILLNQPVTSKPPLESLPKYQAAIRDAQADLGDSGRILVRYSGTENKVRVMVEGPDEERIKKTAERLRDTLRQEIG